MKKRLSLQIIGTGMGIWNRNGNMEQKWEYGREWEYGTGM